MTKLDRRDLIGAALLLGSTAHIASAQAASVGAAFFGFLRSASRHGATMHESWGPGRGTLTGPEEIGFLRFTAEKQIEKCRELKNQKRPGRR